MASKINQETLVLLDFTEFIRNQTPMPQSSVDWIAKNGIPDEKLIIKKQRNTIGGWGITRQRKTQGMDFKDKIFKASERYGRKSSEVVALCKEARTVGTSWRNLARWAGVSVGWLKNQISPTKEYFNFAKLFERGLNKKSLEVANLAKSYYNAGSSLNQISEWSGISPYSLKKILKK